MSVAGVICYICFFFSSRRRHTRCLSDWSSDVCSSDLQQLRAVPANVQLDSGRDFQRVVLLAEQPGNVLQQLDDGIAGSIADPAVAALEPVPHGVVVRPLRDGETALVLLWNGRELRVPVVVRNAAQQPPTSFRNEIVPALTAAGCNAGSCHGAASGKNGFLLSLFGYDPARDHRMLTRDLRGRRLDFLS